MKRLVDGMLMLGLAVLVAVPLLAQEAKKPGKKAADPYAGVFSFPKKIKLDEKQTAKLAALKTEYGPKLADLDKQKRAIMTPERVTAAAAARQKVVDEAKGKELTKEEKKEFTKKLGKAYNDSLKLTGDEQKELARIGKARTVMLKEINDKKMAVLTDAQKEELKAKPKPKDK